MIVRICGEQSEIAQQKVPQDAHVRGSQSFRQRFAGRYNHGLSGQNEDKALAATALK